ncbi:hypothetical protein PRK78_002330 [Emydomyces testavorans]|uniref:CFEM domain-containing protein n=1 Tax=Emydomyces testavorans TaxID=2070801 RepID=A0AAF0IGD1_9EURO|nr:hypothetical protein PRK78_002330 [Emydomyces testavorans]
MQFSHALIALVAAGLASAQLPDIPACSARCFYDALTTDGCSGLTDFKCHCTKPELPGKITPCVEQNCPELASRIAVSNIVVEQCSKAGVPIKLPPVDTRSSGGASSQPATSQPGSSSSGAPSSQPTSGSPAPTSQQQPTSRPNGTGSTRPTGTGSFTVTGRPTASTPATFPGAGSNVRANVGGVAAALLGLAAYL